MTECTHFSELETRGLRRTRDRHGILRLFDRERAWTVGQLHAALPRMDLSTVYRNVQKLAAAGLLAEVHVHGKEAYYERADRSHHEHLVCDRCDAAECIPCPVTDVAARHALELFGTCTNCASA